MASERMSCLGWFIFNNKPQSTWRYRIGKLIVEGIGRVGRDAGLF